MDVKPFVKPVGLIAAAVTVLTAAALLPLPGEWAQDEASERLHDGIMRAEQDFQATRPEDQTALFHALTDRILALERENGELGQKLAAAGRERRQLTLGLISKDVGRKKLLQRLDTAEANKKDLQQQHDAANQKISHLDGQLANLTTERDTLMASGAALEDQLGKIQETQQAVLRKVRDHTKIGIVDFEDTVSMTGLDIDALLPKDWHEAPGQGGPFIPAYIAGERDPVEDIRGSLARLDLQIGRWEQLQALLRSLPLAAPLAQYRITSTFGPRRDPVNARMAAHHGIDFAAPLGTPVFSTAPGEVVFAGWKSGYGRLVEIDHGFGIRTRYAHLKKIDVKQGRRVGHRQALGLLGASGRSTGAHVHYEVVVRREPRDPMNFLEAGMQLFKNAAPSPAAAAP